MVSLYGLAGKAFACSCRTCVCVCHSWVGQTRHRLSRCCCSFSSGSNVGQQSGSTCGLETEPGSATRHLNHCVPTTWITRVELWIPCSPAEGWKLFMAIDIFDRSSALYLWLVVPESQLVALNDGDGPSVPLLLLQEAFSCVHLEWLNETWLQTWGMNSDWISL